jgi:hypothetical protein
MTPTKTQKEKKYIKREKIRTKDESNPSKHQRNHHFHRLKSFLLKS